MKKKCEICGKILPQEDFSKSYKNRCKACVAEFARDKRYAQKKPERPVGVIGEHIPEGAGPKTAKVLDADKRLYVATAALQGILSNPALVDRRIMNPEVLVDLCQLASSCAYGLIRIIEKNDE